MLNNRNNNKLKLRYLLIGMFTIGLVIYLSTVLNYELVIRNLMHSQGINAQSNINETLMKQSALNNFETSPEQIDLFMYYLQKEYPEKNIHLFGPSQEILRSSIFDNSQQRPESRDIQQAVQSALQGELVFTAEASLKTLFSQVFYLTICLDRIFDWYIPIESSSNKVIAVVQISGNNTKVIPTISKIAIKMLIIAFLSLCCLFLVSYWIIKRADKIIRLQSEELKDQIKRLSNILSINESMQNNMLSASSRAVELNEQFLRRVGSDLHDGPAQSIGYALLRIDKVNQKEQSRVFNQEYHTVKEALTDALEEIRGISSGLVLPELDSMTLEQSMRRVVKQHGKKTKTEVTQYYKDLPEHVPLPLQICSYRFIQESLNNAYRHGQATKVRLLSVYEKGELRISLKDNGKGFRIKEINAENQQLGLLGLKDRVESLGGTFDISSELGVGTKIKMSILIGGGK